MVWRTGAGDGDSPLLFGSIVSSPVRDSGSKAAPQPRAKPKQGGQVSQPRSRGARGGQGAGRQGQGGEGLPDILNRLVRVSAPPPSLLAAALMLGREVFARI